MTEFLHIKSISLKPDLHVHYKYLRRLPEWILRKTGCSEIYTEPENFYALERNRGMDIAQGIRKIEHILCPT